MDEINSTGTLTQKVRELTPLLTGISVIIMLTAAGVLAWMLFRLPGDANENQRFISLLIVFMLALGATAALFAALGLGNAGEAFGLPSGSIRALLALGIMMLFVAFGMPVLTSYNESPIEREETRVPAAQVTDTYRSYRDQGYLVTVVDPGSPETTNAAGERIDGTNARLKIIGRLPARSPDQVDLTKQLLTAIVTLLTTVIGFYFGSRTSTDAIREAGGATPATPPAELRRQLGASLTTAKAQIDRAAATIKRWKDDRTTPENPARLAQIKAAEDLRGPIEEARDAIEPVLAAADAALAAAAAAPAGAERTRHEGAASTHLRQAAALLEGLSARLAGYLEAVGKIA